jgi:ABC-2 type transport system ATP-binding protein
VSGRDFFQRRNYRPGTLQTPSALLRVQDLRKSFGKGSSRVEAVRGVSFEIRAGECFGLLGPNGAGKTTTVEMVEGITDPDAGRIEFRGAPAGKPFRERSGIQFQETALPDFLTVREVLRLFSRLYPRHVPLQELVRLCALDEFLDRDTHKLSGGQRQRVLLAIALVNDPEIVFLDEPTTGLDPQARRNFWALVRSIRAEGKTVVLTTHYMEEAYALCDRIAIMDRGRIIAEGKPDDLLKAHFRDLAVQIPAEDFAAATGDPGRLRGRVSERDGLVEILTPDVNETLRGLIEQDVPLARLKLRERTLEDLFLELTGKELRA